MNVKRTLSAGVLAGCAALLLAGCATEKAWVPVSYVIEPDRGLPPGMNTVAVVDSKVNTVTDQKWSELAANMVQELIQEANQRFGANLKVADRKHLGDVMEEQDLAAAGITSGSDPGQGGKVMEVQGLIQSEINVKVETHTGYATTLSGLGLFGGGGSGYYWRDQYRHGYGGVDIDTREVETVARSITVQTAFKLVDTVNNQNWVTYTSPATNRSDRTTASPIFGSAKTEAELTARDVIIGGAVSKGVREFVSRFLPVEMEYVIPIESSHNKNCLMGVRMLRADDYEMALTHFRTAMADNPQDHRAIFGAGLASEAMGDFEGALKYYKRAYGMEPLRRYGDAKARLNSHMDRIRPPA